MGEWSFVRTDFDPDAEAWREAIFTLGNGYFATRGAAAEARADGTHYPGTYIAGCYNRLASTVDGHTVVNEDLVNTPNWLPLSFRVADGDWFVPGHADLLDYDQRLDMACGLMSRRLRFRDPDGRVTAVEQERLVSMADPHLGCLRTRFTAENWAGRLTVRAALDATVVNSGVERYRDLESRHLEPLVSGFDDDHLWLQVETSTSRIRIGQAARLRVDLPDDRVRKAFRKEPAWVGVDLDLDLEEGESCTVEKAVAIYTSRDRAIEESLEAARSHVRDADDFDGAAGHHMQAWRRLWDAARISVGGQAQQILNLHIFHLLQSVSEHTGDLDVGVPARGLHGEAYRGHVFWDELFVLPLLYLRLPETARQLLLYRWRRLPAARRAARSHGYRGAMFPWQSGADGREESQQLHLNPKSGRWKPDNSDRQWHVNHAIAFNVWKYWEASGDLAFMNHYGAELLLDVARFWGSVAEYDAEADRYDIRGVVGPDEYHDAYPDSERPGVDNNAYTNVMAAWVIGRAVEALRLLPAGRQDELREALGVGDGEIEYLETVRRRLRVAFSPDGVIDQFDGYHKLAELDWDDYRRRYDDIHRMDRILEAEEDSTNRYQVSKQADVLMLIYLLGEDELLGILRDLGYTYDAADLAETVKYYLARTSHGSTLSAVVHASVLTQSDPERSWQFFLDALDSDVEDVQGGTTEEGIHLGAMAGTVDLLQHCYAGLRIFDGCLHIDPSLPAELDELSMRLHFRGHDGVEVSCSDHRVRVRLPASQAPPVRLSIGGRNRELRAGESWDVPIVHGSGSGSHQSPDQTPGSD
jgi:trehalose/maltose hydrolase-like predicted phosphorylase